MIEAGLIILSLSLSFKYQQAIGARQSTEQLTELSEEPKISRMIFSAHIGSGLRMTLGLFPLHCHIATVNWQINTCYPLRIVTS